MFVDSHCHLDFPEYANQVPTLLERMKAARVTHAMCISVDMPDFPNVLALAEAYENLFATVGTHPDYEDTPEPTEDQLVELANHPKILAIGETGLDYYRIGDRTYAQMEWQRERFRTHIRAAKRANKPLIIHTRSASEDTIRILKEEGANQVAGVMHCFTETWDVAQAAMELGFYISFSGIVTFKNAKELQETCKKVPLDRMLIETDAPFLAPIPHRGKTNEPAWVSHVGEFIANLRGISVEEVAQATTHNFKTLFKAPI
ncbi:TatD family hydrolase [Polynucleobacter victoriensis]|uniref:TatD DNase family protein n=1 Tax=Polynucleobacter victoriensis TaxID=2049319 RepID=A0A212T013_9BURK|nr:TatD family hydrolase [Polynucleobacter victoriensis]SNC59367.1 TatD DNase family protein [Polynucleobacter victoriensis]